MADEQQSPGHWRAFLGFVQQWQVLLAVVVGASSLMFSFNEQRRQELDVNRDAVAAARSEAVRTDFRQDPRNTLAEFQVTFPGHAFCAALGFFIAEAGRETRRPDARAENRINEMNDAVLVEVEALAARTGLSAEAFREFVARSEQSAAPPDGEPRCAQIAVDAPRVANPFFETECRLAIESFGQNRCNYRRWTNQRAKSLGVEQDRVAARYDNLVLEEPVLESPTILPAEPDTAGSGAGAAEPEIPEPEADPIAYPEDICGDASPLIFTQYPSEAEAGIVEELRARMLASGWRMMPAERVSKGATGGDVRIYDEAQRPCAEALAMALGEELHLGAPLQVISLQDSYRGLPEDQMELWLPALR